MSLKMFLAAAIAMGGAANFKVGVQNRIHDRRERKNVPHFYKCGVQASKYQ